jgi:parvulin-like peptidyl-prolyl isomerase
MRRGVRLGAAALAAALAFPAMAARAADSGSEVIARIASIEVTTADLRSYIAALDPRDQAALARDPTLLSQSVRQLLASKLVLNEALAKKWDQQPAVAQQLERVRQGAIVETYLQSVAKVPDDFPSDTDLQSAYDANKTAFLQPRQFDIAHIFIAVDKNADKATQDKARKRVDDIQKKLKQKDADFSAIAASESDDPATAKRGGEIGWIAEAQVTPELRKQVAGLAKDGIGDPVQLDDGWHIVKLIDTKAAYTRPLSEVRDQLTDQLRRERAAVERRNYLTKLLQASPPAINELALTKVLAKPADSK